LRTVGTDSPDARATAATPPKPSATASAPANKRRCRSFKYGNNALNFAVNAFSSETTPTTYTNVTQKATLFIYKP
jgi:hypothetical protein